MTITVHHHSGKTTTYSYDPAHYEGVTDYYKDLMFKGEIWFYTVLV
jgi:hypothetical protein